MAPVRTCVGCRRRAAVDELVRVVRLPDGSLAVGRSLPGRGAWLCPGRSECFDRAAGRQAFARALRAPVSGEAVEELGRRLGLRPDVRGWKEVSGAPRGVADPRRH